MVPIPSKHLVIGQPVGGQLIIHRPVLSQAGTNQRSMNQSGTSQLDASMNPVDMNQPSTSLPDMNQLGMKQPVVSQPGMSQPGISESEMSQPGPIQPGVKQLFISKLYRSQCSTSELDTKQPGLSESGMSQRQLGQSQSSPSEPGMKQPHLSIAGMRPQQLRRSQSSPSEPGMKQPGSSQSRRSEPALRQPKPTSTSQSRRKKPSTNFFQIRAAEAQDCIRILHLIQESAAFENMPNAVRLTAKDLLRDGFGNNPLFYCLLAEVFNQKTASGKATAGFAMYYFTYDAWIGKLLYIEDFFVTLPYRGLGIGAAILKKLSQIALRNDCNCMHFHAVIWNEASIDCYTRRGTVDLFSREGRYLFRISKEKLLYLAGEQ